MLAQRAVSAFILLCLLMPATYLGGPWFLAVVIVSGLVAVYEFNAVLRHAGLRPWFPLQVALTVALILSGYFSHLGLDRPILSLALIAVSVWQLSRPAEERSLADWGMTLAPAIYLGWLGAAVLLVRLSSQGWRWTFFMFLIIFATDTAAYFGGRAFGRRQFAPTISPKKTWEGALIAWAYTTLVAVGLARYLQLPLEPLHAVVLGSALSWVSMLGDLTISFVKRQSHVKDASHLIPGHGGLLDRLDSILPAAAVLYTYMVWFGVN